MIKSLIIGAGNLGSRHLQGLLKVALPQVIYVVDPSREALETSSSRAQEVENNHELIYRSNWEQLPSEFDFVIVATGANVRSRVVTKLLRNFKVKNLVLEKILFQDLNSFSEIGKLIKKTNTPTWVNHPRRMFNHYKEIKRLISRKGDKASFQVYGGNWGLACNGLHFIDIFGFLSDSQLKWIDFGGVEKVIKSKRLNNIEFIGSIKGEMEDGSDFKISSIDGPYSDISVCVFTKSSRWIIQEGTAQKVIYLDGKDNYNESITSFKTEFQSSLTTQIVNNCLSNKKITLPNYFEASRAHIPFIKNALDAYINITGVETAIIPIT